MYLVPWQGNSRWRGTKFEDAVVYPDGSEKPIPPESIDAPFVARLTDFMQKMASDKPARRVPSEFECGQCDLTSADCPVKIEARAA